VKWRRPAMYDSKQDVTPGLRGPRITNCILPLAAALALLLVGYSFGYVKWQDISWQPAQMWSKVDYDPKLSDPFFDSDEWICEDGYISSAKCRDGKYVQILRKPGESRPTGPCGESKEWTCPDGCKKCAICKDGTPVVKCTAKCISNSRNVEHPVSFCEAKFSHPNTIDLFIHTEVGLCPDRLRIQITDRYFRCQYWTVYMAQTNVNSSLVWSTILQKLTLEKEEYHSGDLIKGKIEFECLESTMHPKYTEKRGRHRKTSIKVYGAFKTIVQ